MCDVNTLICTDVHSISFQIYTTEETHKLSVASIESSITFESDGITPRRGGLHDPRLGPMDARTPCHHCGARKDCFGHIGHIPLKLPVFHPTLLGGLVKLLKLICFRCKRLKMSAITAGQYLKKFEFLQNGMLDAYEQFQSIVASKPKPFAKTKPSGDGEGGSDNSLMTREMQLQNERRVYLKRLFAKLQEMKSSRSDPVTLEAADLCKDISDASHLLNSWMKLRNELFATNASKRRCTHCTRSFNASVKESKNSMGIDVTWPAGTEAPFGRETWEESNLLEADSGTENEAAHFEMKEFSKVYGKRGQALCRYHLEAFQLLPILKQLYNTKDVALFDFLFPGGIKVGWKIFFIESLPVSANRFRPLVNTSGGVVGLHPRTASLLDIIRSNEKLVFALRILKHPDPIAGLEDPTMYKDISGVEMTSITDAEKEALKKAVVEHAEAETACIIGYSKMLQEKVNSITDQTKAENPESTPVGIRQWIERKQGAIRQKMMGKRVNYSARTVIAPDCYLESNQIGVPLTFAKKLTVPEYVTPRNVGYLRKLVENGPNVYPGAMAFKDSKGNTFNLEALSAVARRSKSQLLLTDDVESGAPRIVYRHLRDGDVVLMNRQPTLHKPGIMAHFVKILGNERVFRMNYVNCSTYNADFDGDEMNLHVPQDLMAMAEARMLANADCQFTVPKSGEPIRGLIQDHIQGGAILTSRGTFLSKGEYQTLVYAALNSFADKNAVIRLEIDMSGGTDTNVDGMSTVTQQYSEMLMQNKDDRHLTIHVERPAVLKPRQLWTGKQVITSILKTMVDSLAMDRFKGSKYMRLFRGVNLTSKSKTPGDAWGGCEDGDVEEATVIIRDSELLQGVLDKSQYGSSSFGLTHLVFELLGPSAAGLLLNAFSRVFTTYLQMRGTTCSPSDFLMNSVGEAHRQRLIEQITLGGTLLQETIIRSLDVSGTTNNRSEAPPSERHEETEDSKPYIKEAIRQRWEEQMQSNDETGLAAYRSMRIPPHCENWRDMDPSTYQKQLNYIAARLRKEYKTEEEMMIAANKLLLPMQMMQHEMKQFRKLQSTAQHSDIYIPKNAASNEMVMLPNHKPLPFNGSTKTAVTYHPSWLWHRTKATSNYVDFNSPAMYENCLMDTTKQHRSYHLIPSILTPNRFSSLIKEKYKGRETDFYELVDRLFQSTLGKVTSKANNLVSGKVSLYKFPMNGFSTMVLTGSKGSKVNYGMICGMLSQQSLEGKRVPIMRSGKTLPSFAQFDFGCRAGGLITDRFLTGLRPQEYFFHCMSGREGLIDTAVKTAKSGYLQRCVVKGMEGVTIRYDGTVRDSDGKVIQFIYGEDGLDVCKTPYLSNLDDFMNNPIIARATFNCKEARKHPDIRNSLNEIKQYIKGERASLQQPHGECVDNNVSRGSKDPILSVYHPSNYVGSVSENFQKKVQKYLGKNYMDIWKADVSSLNEKSLKKELELLLLLKYRSGVSPAGEAVGCLAAQSMGEPATQMTLNTFHLAGHGAANVTMGIPRLREILQTAGTPSTPYMYIPLKLADDLSLTETIQAVLRGFRNISLSDVIHGVGIESNVYYRSVNRASDGDTLHRTIPTGQDRSFEKYWQYEASIQFENLAHFCMAVPQFTPNQIFKVTLNVILTKFLKEAFRLMTISVIRNGEYEITNSTDELQEFFKNFILDNRSSNNRDLKAKMKDLGSLVGSNDVSTQLRDAPQRSAAEPKDEGYDTTSKRRDAEDASDGGKDDASDASDEEAESQKDGAGSDDLEIEVNEPYIQIDTENALQETDEQDVKMSTGTRSPEESDSEQIGSTDVTQLAHQIANGLQQKSEPHELDGDERPSQLSRGSNNKMLKHLEPLPADAMWASSQEHLDRLHKINSAKPWYKLVRSIRVCRKSWRLIVKFGWPASKCPYRLDFLTLLVNILKPVKLQEAVGVSNARVVRGENSVTGAKYELQCQGSNVQWIHRLRTDCVDHNRIISNDIKATLSFYGVEAARASIIVELKRVFGVYGINVDYRHLTLIADFMTQNGGFSAFNRIGIAASSSPLLQMSFETSLKFLGQACERGAYDNLHAPAGAIVAGRTPFVGTGVSQLLSNLTRAMPNEGDDGKPYSSTSSKKHILSASGDNESTSNGTRVKRKKLRFSFS